MATTSKRSNSKTNSGKSASSKNSGAKRSGKTTTDHDKIRTWAESRGGHPATVKSTAKRGAPGILRIDFPGYRGAQSLDEISWDDFFDKFDEEGLAFLYQDKTATGRPSRFNKLINRKGSASRSR